MTKYNDLLSISRRIAKEVNGALTYYIYDGDNINAEYTTFSSPENDLNNLNDFNNLNYSLSALYIHGNGIDTPLAMVRGNQIFYYHSDALGSVKELTNDIGNIVQKYEYDSFGKITLQEGFIVNPYTFTSREYDLESSLYYYRARYYDPETGRFIQEDPIFDVNLYAYVGNNPINLIDPYGAADYTASLDPTKPEDPWMGEEREHPLYVFCGKGKEANPGSIIVASRRKPLSVSEYSKFVNVEGKKACKEICKDGSCSHCSSSEAVYFYCHRNTYKKKELKHPQPPKQTGECGEMDCEEYLKQLYNEVLRKDFPFLPKDVDIRIVPSWLKLFF